MVNVKIMGKLEKAEKFLGQFPMGITASDFAEKFGKHIRKEVYRRQTGYDYLNSLVLRAKAEKKDTLFYPITAGPKKTSTEPKVSGLGFFGYRKWKIEHDELKEQHALEELEKENDKDIKEELEACLEWRAQFYPQNPELRAAMERKDREELGLI
jgi:hypothetical protein